jgi:DNA modification methylase
MSVRILNGDCRQVLATLPAESVHCVVTSPPYFGLRDYGVPGQIGLEASPDEFVATLVGLFRDVRRILRADGTLWLNLGDSYATDAKAGGAASSTLTNGLDQFGVSGHIKRDWRSWGGFKRKDLIGVPWMVAFALRADGWWLRQRLPWVKRNPMPESTRDRPTSAVEDVFLLSKSETYFYDYDAVRRTMAPASVGRLAQDVEAQEGSARANGGAKTNGAMKAVRGDKQRGHSRRHAGFNDRWDQMEREEQRGERAFRNTDLFFASLDAPHGAVVNDGEIIALDVATHSFKEAHFATFPPALIEPCVLAGCPKGGTVLDPFGGAGTTGLVADRLGRNAILIELNPEYSAMAERRISRECGMFADVAVEATA